MNSEIDREVRRRAAANWKRRVSVIVVMAAVAACSPASRAAEDDDAGHEGHEHPAASAPAGAAHVDQTGGPDHPGEHDEHEAHGGHAEHADEVKLPPEAMRAFNIKVEPATRQVLAATILAPARVSFNTERMAHVGSAVSGRVSEIKVRLGDSVKKGEVLLVVDSPELGEAQSDYLVKRAGIATAQSAMEAAGSSYQRAKGLYDESRGIALTEVQKREAEFRAAQGALTSAQAAATAAENRLHLLGMDQQAVQALVQTGEIAPRYAVRAPLDGQVVEREATLGELVSPEREALMVLADMSTVWVLADVPEARLDDVAVGSKARVRLNTRARETLAGVVSHIAPQLDPGTRSVQVRIEISNGHLPLKPGMFAQAQISAAAAAAGGQAQGVLAIPDEAVQMVEGEPSVFVPVDGEAGTFARRPVKVAPAVGGMVPVLDGLAEGQPLVTSGSFILKAELGKGSAGHEH